MNAPQKTSLAAALGLALLAGCDQPTGSTRPRSSAPAQVAPEPVAEAPAPEARRPILGERTQDIRDPSKETRAGGVETKGVITAKDPITVVGSAYVSSIGRTAQGNIDQAIRLYHASHDAEYPKTHEEFMEHIIKANNIALPLLPSYQKYVYNVEEHRLVIREYPH